MRFQLFLGNEIEPHLESLGRLRLKVFREYPYLYEGALETEVEHLKCYSRDASGMLLALFDDADRLVGAATGLPALAPWEDASLLVFDPQREGKTFYWGEFILEKPFRGKKWGQEMYRRGEETIFRTLGFENIGIYMIRTSEADAKRPADYLDVKEFVKRRGYRLLPDAQVVWDWAPVGETRKVPHTLDAWLKRAGEF
ncbi:MAG: hypothetical protein Q4D38_10885 [Planctomycetia bacterium]|nr:hypothetical protein [Planctomycetia bacterium]